MNLELKLQITAELYILINNVSELDAAEENIARNLILIFVSESRTIKSRAKTAETRHQCQHHQRQSRHQAGGGGEGGLRPEDRSVEEHRRGVARQIESSAQYSQQQYSRTLIHSQC